MTALPHSVSLVSRLIPAAEREGIVGDLIEAAGDRDIRGARLTLWLLVECARPFRRARMGPVSAFVSLLLMGASTVAIAFTAELLVGALFSASGLR